MKAIFFFFIFLVSASAPLSAQNFPVHSLSAELLGGSSITTISVFEEEDMNIIGFTAAARVLWEPEYLLRIGVEGGFLHLAHSKEENIQTEFGPTKRANSLNAYPMMLHFSMNIWKLECMLGLGAAFITSKINAFDDISMSSVITSAKMYGIGYSMTLSGRFSIGCELKYTSFSTPDISIAAFQLKGKYSIVKW